MLHHLDADVKDIVDGVGNIASISATRAPQDSKPWYCSRLVNEKIRAFHNECAAVPTDNDARVCYENYMNSLKKYLKSNNLCDREEYRMAFSRMCLSFRSRSMSVPITFYFNLFRNSFNNNLLLYLSFSSRKTIKIARNKKLPCLYITAT